MGVIYSYKVALQHACQMSPMLDYKMPNYPLYHINPSIDFYVNAIKLSGRALKKNNAMKSGSMYCLKYARYEKTTMAGY